ncbi:MAG TPA: hypothetical protein VFS43_10445 [Polyangiaceae bacterium]|nr:hypothetical protein [Polyangiaceae bacterium]
MSYLRPPRRRTVRLSPLGRVALGCAVALAWAAMPFYHGLAWLSTRWRRWRARPPRRPTPGPARPK